MGIVYDDPPAASYLTAPASSASPGPASASTAAAAGVLRDLKAWIRALEPATRARDQLDGVEHAARTRPSAGRGR
jgi:hypothetical protein